MKSKYYPDKYLRYMVFLPIVIFLASILARCSTNKENVIYEEKSLDEIKAIASSANKDICIVLYQDSNSIFQTYINKLNTDFKALKDKSIFNTVKISDRKNQWYQHWLCLRSSVVTCILSPKGELKNIIGGASSYSFKYIEEAIQNNIKDICFGYKTSLSLDEKETINTLNRILFCKNNLAKGKDINQEIDETLKKIVYPYNLYLKFQNLYQIKKDTIAAIDLGNRLLSLKKDKKYAKLYQNIFDETEQIINPDGNSNSLSYLATNKTIYLPNCKISETRVIDLEVTNQGKTMLVIEEIDLGCDCMTLDSTFVFNKKVSPEEKTTIKIKFTPRSLSDTIKHIFIISNAKNYFEQIDIKALVHQ